MASWNDREEAVEIDLDYKTAKIPGKYKNMAVCGDNLTDIIPFKLVNNFRGFDLSNSENKNYVIWETPNGSLKRGDISKIETVGDYTWFQWIVPGIAAAVEGEIRVELLFSNGSKMLHSPIMDFTLLPTLTGAYINDDEDSGGVIIPPGSDSIDSTEIDIIFGGS